MALRRYLEFLVLEIKRNNSFEPTAGYYVSASTEYSGLRWKIKNGLNLNQMFDTTKK